MRPVTGIACAFTLLFVAAAVAGQDMAKDCPMHAQHKKAKDASEMNRRGDTAMGFDQTKTTHHFLLKDDGGVIQVTANDPKDTASEEQVRQHLAHIARAFASGDFDIPMFVHDQVPPGVPEMKRLKGFIHYTFEDIETGARVVITTKDAKALAAVHDFLRFQIREHQTGDPLRPE